MSDVRGITVVLLFEDAIRLWKQTRLEHVYYNRDWAFYNAYMRGRRDSKLYKISHELVEQVEDVLFRGKPRSA